ncbi:MAG TPA: alcohol dehydrogenase catalytic domain-containing protein [Smithellaceae bacterium]|jgi:2-desacetyl-2-hydroxyethyl bacteriochlorophyllide A dehydrogenase|nr:alcohol dehydrogenase catalytic domain-containing protein [Syntrophaceae bacterium]NMC91407.1 alcohol dehydrogenase catalytic domain-containing protein [Smithella sp.]HNV55962.1 alcohol dehydrogenase catalytic domain-containing protein [Smithellaceae bacterium]HNY95510.1 alcohol dehydrogenase catalytic domain-containing protein [Smithellaceae bacterium]HOD63504.1 alcohol dehydrogenase catalytic domain-containing protein [Smithellaceae bacterium]
MKAAVLRGAKDIRTETVPDPVCAPHGVIVKVNSCGVCGSDLHWYKEDGHEGTIFGHEFSGDIVEVGKNVQGIAVGTRCTAVGFSPCGQCFWCKQGKAHRCSAMALLGYQFPGAMAEYVHVPFAALGRSVFPLPEELTYEDAASVEPLSISYFSVNRGQPKTSDIVAVIGLGVIGLYAVQILKALGVEKVLAAGRRPSRLAAAKRCGADPVIDAAAEDTLQAVMQATDQLGVNTVVECAGNQATFDQAVAMARGGGKILLVGIYEEALHWQPLSVISKNLTLVGCLGGNFPAVIELLKSGKASSRGIISHRFPLSQAAEAFRTQLQDPTAVKVMVQP